MFQIILRVLLINLRILVIVVIIPFVLLCVMCRQVLWIGSGKSLIVIIIIILLLLMEC